MTRTASQYPTKAAVLVINCGSSSIRFAFFSAQRLINRQTQTTRQLYGQIERIGQTATGATLHVHEPGTSSPVTLKLTRSDQPSAIAFLLDWLEQRPEFAALQAVGHRVVHGMGHSQPEIVSAALMAELNGIRLMCPEQLPGELARIEALQTRHPAQIQIVCFDTAFHHNLRPVGQLLPIPRRYFAQGVRRYGFHGLSYESLLMELTGIAGEDAARGKLIFAHLGNGSSLTAIQDGKSIDTSMGFTPTSGIPMSSRSGDLDPGLIEYLSRTEGMDAAAFHRMINAESGLLGISETTSDMHDLLIAQATDVRAAEAVAVFCHHIKKCIGALTTVLGSIDTIVFAGGIDENSAEIRARACRGPEFLGIAIDPARNLQGAGVISAQGSTVEVRVMPVDKEQVIAAAVHRVLRQTTWPDRFQPLN